MPIYIKAEDRLVLCVASFWFTLTLNKLTKNAITGRGGNGVV